MQSRLRGNFPDRRAQHPASLGLTDGCIQANDQVDSDFSVGGGLHRPMGFGGNRTLLGARRCRMGWGGPATIVSASLPRKSLPGRAVGW